MELTSAILGPNGYPLSVPGKVRDSAGKVIRTVDSTGAFMVGELERLDYTLHMPLASVTWHRDIDLRQDVTIADELSSFTLSTMGSPGGLGTGNGVGTGKSWAGKNTNQVTSQSLDISKTTNPLHVWEQEVKFTILELESAAKTGRPVDQQKFEALQLKHQMDIDEQVYVGDLTTGDTGLLNSSLITNNKIVSTGAAGYTQWASKQPDEMLADVNELVTSVWSASGWAVMPNRLLLPPVVFGLISTLKVSNAGNVSVLKYLEENNITVRANKGGALQIFPNKWLVGLEAGIGSTSFGVPPANKTSTSYDVMFCYTKQYNRVRFPMTMLQRTPIQYSGIWHMTTYFCRLGVVEVVYPETAGWRYGV
jgi:hypothetical protein